MNLFATKYDYGDTSTTLASIKKNYVSKKKMILAIMKLA